MDTQHHFACPCGETTFDLTDREPGDALRCPACGRVTTVPDPSAATAEMEAPRPIRRSQMSRRERVAQAGSVLDMNEEQFERYAERKSPIEVKFLRVYRRLGVKGILILWHVLLVVGALIIVAWKIAQGAEFNIQWGTLILVIVIAGLLGVGGFVLHTFVRHKMKMRATAQDGGRASSRRSGARVRRSSRRVSAISSARKAAEPAPDSESGGKSETGDSDTARESEASPGDAPESHEDGSGEDSGAG